MRFYNLLLVFSCSVLFVIVNQISDLLSLCEFVSPSFQDKSYPPHSSHFIEHLSACWLPFEGFIVNILLVAHYLQGPLSPRIRLGIGLALRIGLRLALGSGIVALGDSEQQ